MFKAACTAEKVESAKLTVLLGEGDLDRGLTLRGDLDFRGEDADFKMEGEENSISLGSSAKNKTIYVRHTLKRSLKHS